MALLILDSFDLYNGTGTNTGLQAKWVPSTTSGLSLVTGRFSGRAVEQAALGGLNAGPGYRVLPSTYTSGGVGFAMRCTSFPAVGVDATVCPFIEVLSGANYQLGVKLKNDGSLVVYRLTGLSAGTVLGTTAAGVILLNSWHFLEWGFAIHDSTGTITLKVDAATVLNLTGQDTNNSGGNWDRVQFLQPAGSTVGTYQIDDLYCLDSATTLGERRVETLYPTSDVAQGFARSTGSTNYTLVDEATVNGDTDYVQGSTVGDVDTYGFGDLSSTPTTIDAVQVTAFAEKTDAGSRSIALQVKSGATTSDGSNYALAASYGKFERILTTDPNTATAWTGSGVNAMQGGPKVTV